MHVTKFPWINRDESNAVIIRADVVNLLLWCCEGVCHETFCDLILQDDVTRLFNPLTYMASIFECVFVHIYECERKCNIAILYFCQ